MPALRALEPRNVALPDASAAEAFGAKGAAPGLRPLAVASAELTPAAARMLAAAAWRLEALDLSFNDCLGAAGVAAPAAAPALALRRLELKDCGLDADALLSVASARRPLEELDLSQNDFSAAAAGPALASLPRLKCLRKLT